MQKTIKENTSCEIIEKKSKFIANLFYVQSQEEAEEKIKEIKKKYHDARHNCYAYSIMTNAGIINKMSDDGEPSGTAGSPMLNILLKKELINVLVVVTRYFGGILLGTGGLVRAYSEATLLAIEKAQFVIEENGYEMEMIITYPELEKIQYYFEKNEVSVINKEYGEEIKFNIQVTKEEKDKIIKLKEEGMLKIKEYNIIKEINVRKTLKYK